ncbi:ATP-dependent protease ClpP protease subunit [Eubacterium multiforme]|uniref:ATP-dependent Clp protease proteolytic subunit n=1 Tax=Eubacterium multiforme TaxID=83339 RepID=A0ABT9US39_9FIRM|nr:head maturation protease, ClpP-related [Eubacterium multiforme]MDQ0149130.1 ATP-dependent protease ClpP protease subunit [Eubacterium multiforme]
MKNKFFEVKNKTESTAEIYIVGEIMTEKPWYEDGEESKDNYLRDFIKTMQNLKDMDELEIHINSPGGALFAGVSMYNLFKNHKAKKKVYIDFAASAASLVALAGDEIIIPKNAFLMVHKPIMGARGNANDFKKAIEMLESIEVGMMSIYEENLINESDKELVNEMVQKETWLNGEEASAIFKNMKVTEEIDVAACSNFDFSLYNHIPKELLGKAKEKNENTLDDKKKEEIENKKKLELAKAKLGLLIA